MASSESNFIADSRDLTRRAALGALGAVAAGFMLFGPRGRESIPRNRVVLDYWEKWTGHEGRAMRAVVDRFNESQNRLWVRYLPVASIDQKAQVAIAGGSPPDILGLWNYNVPGYAESGAILPFDAIQDELSPSQRVVPENYAAGMRPIMTHPDSTGKDRVWAVISTGGTLAMYYNKKLLAEAPGRPIQPPRTIGELDALNDKLMVIEGTGKDAKIKRMAFHHREPGWWSFIWGNAFGGNLYDVAANRATMAAAPNVRAYDWVQSYPARFGLEAVNTFRSSFARYDTAQNAFLIGQLACLVQGPWLANIIGRYAPDLDYGVVPFPVADDLYNPAEHDANPIGLIDTDIIVVPRGVKHPEASMEFIAFTQQQENVEFLSTAHFKSSPLAQCSDEFKQKHPNKGIEVFDRVAKSTNAYRCPKTRTWLQLKDEMDQSLDAIWNMKGKPGEVLAATEKRSQAILDRAAESAARRKGTA